MLGDLLQIAADLRDYRDLLLQLTLRDVKIRYKQAVMGLGWAVFMPVLVVLSAIVVRFAMAYLSGGNLDRTELGGIAMKSVGWAFFVSSLGFANTSLVGNINLVTKVYFPREVLPLGTVLAQAFDTVVGSTVLAVALPFLGARLSMALLWNVPLAALLFLFTVAAALFVSSASLFFRDVKYLVQVVLMFGIFFTPVFFEPAMLGPTWSLAVMLNPLAPILEGLRLATMDGANLLQPLTTLGAEGIEIVTWSPWYLVYSAGLTLGALTAAALMFHRLEFLFAEYA